jgi:hypothetical protein
LKDLLLELGFSDGALFEQKKRSPEAGSSFTAGGNLALSRLKFFCLVGSAKEFSE